MAEFLEQNWLAVVLLLTICWLRAFERLTPRPTDKEQQELQDFLNSDEY